MLSAIYTSYRIPSDPAEVRYNIEVLHSILSDIDFRVAQTAVRKYAVQNVSSFAPSAGEIRRLANEILFGSLQTPAQAWETVLRAVRTYGYARGGMALDSMDALTGRVVHAMGYAELCRSENQTADRAHFIKLYETERELEGAGHILPESVREAIAEIAETERKREGR